ncbi:MAG: hypothetical protein QW594_03900 [Candidatus Woesearchaeota archaeon]
MKLIHSQFKYPLLILDLLRKNTTLTTLQWFEGQLFLDDKEFDVEIKKHEKKILLGGKEFLAMVDETGKWYSIATQTIPSQLSEVLALITESIKKMPQICLYHEAAKKIILSHLPVEPEDRYEAYILFGLSAIPSKHFQQKADLYDLALLIERNKTLKKSFTSSPEKIIEKIQTFYINIHNRMLSHVRKYGWLSMVEKQMPSYDELDLIRELKLLIKEANIKRSYQGYITWEKQIKKSSQRFMKRYHLTKNVLMLSDRAKAIAALMVQQQEALQYLFFHFQKLLAVDQEYQRYEPAFLLNLKWDEFTALPKLPKRVPPQHYNHVRLQKQLLAQHLPKKKRAALVKKIVLGGIANFTDKKKGVVGISKSTDACSILVLNTFDKPADLFSDTAPSLVVVDEIPSIFSPFFPALKAFPSMIGTQVASHFCSQQQRLLIDGKSNTLHFI